MPPRSRPRRRARTTSAPGRCGATRRSPRHRPIARNEPTSARSQRERSCWRRYRKHELLAGRGDAGGARAHRAAESGAERLQSRLRAGARRREGLRGALDARAAAGPARRRAGVDQGPHPDQGLADAARLEDGRPEGPVERRRAGDRAAARARRGAPRQDHDARIRLEGRHRQPAHRHHAQSLEPGEDARRLLRRRGRRGRRRHGPARGRHRRRRLDPHPVRASPASSASSRRSAACRRGRSRPSAPWRTSGR